MMPEQLSMQEVEFLDFEYSPSRHSKRFQYAEDAVKNHVKYVEEETRRVRGNSNLKSVLDVQYGESEDEVLDIYSTIDAAPDAPIFCFIHGGYWQALTKNSYGSLVQPLTTKGGYKVFIINYSLCPKVTLAEIVEQIRTCFMFIYKYAIEHRSRFISMCGHSAGAHLIMSALQSPSLYNLISTKRLFKSMYLIAGVYNLTKLRYAPSVNHENLLGINDNNVHQLSPYFADFSHLKGSRMSFKFFLGEHESRTFCQESEEMRAALSRSCKCEVTFEIIADVDHFDIIENLSSDRFCITKYIINDALENNI